MHRRPAADGGSDVPGHLENTEQRRLTRFSTEKAYPRGNDTCAGVYREDRCCLTVTIYFFLFPCISYDFCFTYLCFFVVKVSNGLWCLFSLWIVTFLTCALHSWGCLKMWNPINAKLNTNKVFSEFPIIYKIQWNN